MIFWIVLVVLIVLAVLVMVLPVLRATGENVVSNREQQNIDIAREKKSLLERQLEQEDFNQEEFDSALKELKTALALDLETSEQISQGGQGKWAAWVLAVAMPVVSLLLYFELGEYRVIGNPALAEIARPAAEQQQSNLSIPEMVEVLKKRLSESPEDARSWYMLGKAMVVQNDYPAAVTAYQRAYDLVSDQPEIMFSLADAMAMKNNGSMLGEPSALVKRGLGFSPLDPTGLWLAGLAAEQEQDNEAAMTYWTRLLPLIKDDADSAQEVRRLIFGLGIGEPPVIETATPPVSARSLNLSVSLSTDMLQKAAPGDAVFVYAKAMNGPPMPLAVKRMTVRDLPAEVSLSDADAMIPAMKLSNFDLVIVGARVSKSGNPVAQPGDLYVELTSVDSKKPPTQLSLSIDQIK
jgi:cytochrome c-type biogenesis protein CcmH